ncbi:MAG: hypothetical protein DRQ39_04375 [Gammaproteobacteria bacterium]|nr:MAG: hypothetical protein DRQ39_04375 [Gammaproteobacteria bacterium]
METFLNQQICEWCFFIDDTLKQATFGMEHATEGDGYICQLLCDAHSEGQLRRGKCADDGTHADHIRLPLDLQGGWS